MSAAVAQLVEQGWVTKAPNPADARGTVVTLSDSVSPCSPGPPLHGERVAALVDAHPDLTTEDLATAVAVPPGILRKARREPPPHHEPPGSILQQPRAVWAVAFACVIAFMGIGLVDPILKQIAAQLDATPSQVSLLFTSYMAIMGVAMLVTGVVSSRIGPKRTLLSGLVLIIVFAALAGASDSVGAIVGFRAGWGLGNALFVATALATIVSVGAGLGRAGDHPVRGRARPRHRVRPAHRRPARRAVLARPVLRRLGADDDRAGRDRGLPADHPAGRARDVARRPVPRAAAPRRCC